ncbi:MAG: putative metal-binding motif-containing protein [Bacteroidetes bacterium]|nr:putative metal-binding motif-containing protein [Bacteroidota bacterium]
MLIRVRQKYVMELMMIVMVLVIMMMELLSSIIMMILMVMDMEAEQHGFCSDPGGTYVLLTGDCDDDNIAVNPAATEICNGIDDDCDGLGDYDDGIIFLDYYADLDGDGYGSGAAFGFCSDPGGTYVLLTGDCDDDNTAVNPAATEICNGIDDDCDGLGDYDDGIIFLDYYADLDGDGYGTGAAFGFCSDPGGTYVLLTGDCNDGDNSIYPDATEVCNFIDDDCDGTADDGITYLIYYTDADLDAYGAGLGANYCSDPGAGFSLNNLDCEDGDASINPGEIDLCNGIDNDCDGLIDNDAIFTTYYYDGDGDSYGNSLDLA